MDRRKFNGRPKGSKNQIQGQAKEKSKAQNSIQADFRDDSNLASQESLKIRPGETKEQWDKRTIKKRRYGLNSKENKIKIASNGKLYFHKRFKKQERMRALTISVRIFERPFDFMKAYPVIMRWANAKYGVVQNDFELGYYFYEGTPFTKLEFESVCTMLGSVRFVFSRFVKKGYIQNITIVTSKGVEKPTEYYQLTMRFHQAIGKIYGMITKTAKVNIGKTGYVEKMSDLLRMEIEKMNDEVVEILKGNQKQETIKIEN